MGVLAWVCRATLKSLKIRECSGVKLPRLLFGECWKVKERLSKYISYPHKCIPPDPVDRHNPLVGTSPFVEVLQMACLEMVEAHGQGILEASNRMLAAVRNAKVMEENNIELFGRLETLDVSLTGNTRTKFEGCISTIAWLNGGRLREIYMFGLSNLTTFDISVLNRTCGSRIQVAEYDVSLGPLDTDIPDVMWPRSLCQLDISNCSGLINRAGDTYFLCKLHNLRTLKLNFLDEFNEDGLQHFLSESKRLLSLKMVGCRSVSCSKLINSFSANKDLKLLSLDIRGINMDCPLSELQQVCCDLLELNNWSTDIGKARVREHIKFERTRAGSRAVAVTPFVGTKRRRDRVISLDSGTCYPCDSAKSSSNNMIPRSRNVCSLLRTGFLKHTYSEQQLFICKTCKINYGHVVCSTCVRNCHKGHETFAVGYSLGHCDCCILSDCICFDQ